MSTGVIIARFQTPYLHPGHIELIKTVREKHDNIVVILGIAAFKSKRNPFDYYTREKLIKAEFPEIVILPLRDHPSDQKWSQNLDQLLADTLQRNDFTLYGSRDSFLTSYHGNYSSVELPAKESFSATQLREQFSNKVFDSTDFRAGILYGLNNQYPKVYPTVDIAVFRNNRSEMLLGKKHNAEKWRLPGGFVDPTDQSFEEAAKRELTEETGIIDVSALQYETSSLIDDWRYRNEIDKIITTLYSCEIEAGDPKGNDDLKEVAWFKLEEIALTNITAEHHILINFLTAKY